MLGHIVELYHHAVEALCRSEVSDHCTDSDHGFLIVEISLGVGKGEPLAHTVFIKAHKAVGGNGHVFDKQLGNGVDTGRTARQYNDVAVVCIKHHRNLLHQFFHGRFYDIGHSLGVEAPFKVFETEAEMVGKIIKQVLRRFLIRENLVEGIYLEGRRSRSCSIKN